MNTRHVNCVRSGVAFLLIICLSACGSAAQTTLPTITATERRASTSTPTKVPTARPTKHLPTATWVPPATPSPEGMLFIPGQDVTFQGVKLSLPTNLASGVRAQVAPAVDHLGELYPAHIEFTLTDYGAQNTQFEPQILIYPIRELSKAVPQSVAELKALLAEQPATLPFQGIPILPVIPAGQLIDVQIQYLTSKNLSGIRVLTQLAQDRGPINNEDLVYIFQGVTNDGAYYISAFMPVAAPYLPNKVEDPDAVPPLDGFPYPKSGSPNFDTEYSDYYQAVTRKLNITASEVFDPDLSTLDSLVGSLRFEFSAEQQGFSCLNALPSRLRVGLFAHVNPEPPLPNNVRSDPGKNASVIGDIEAGKAMKILEGPQCVDGWFWWRVRALDTDLQGWTAEGDSKNYWLIPCDSRNDCGP